MATELTVSAALSWAVAVAVWSTQRLDGLGVSGPKPVRFFAPVTNLEDSGREVRDCDGPAERAVIRVRGRRHNHLRRGIPDVNKDYFLLQRSASLSS